MFKGFVLSESLKDPTILNNFNKDYVKIEHHPETPKMLYWHLFKLNIEDLEIDDAAEKLANQMKYGWFSHFWNKENIVIVFNDKVFRVPKSYEGSREYKEFTDYAVKNGVEEEYLELPTED